MKKFLAVILVSALTIFAGCNLLDDNVFVVGIDDEFAPMTFRDDNGELVGLDIDLANATAKRMGVKFEFKPIDWDNKEAEISLGNIDMIWSACDIIDEYNAYMIFSKPYMDNRQIILAQKNYDVPIRSEKDLAGKIVGTQSGSNSETYVNGNLKLKKILADFKTYRTVKDGFTALANGEIELLIIDEIAARYEMKKSADKFKLFDVTIGPVTKFGIGFRKDDTELRDNVQKVFGTLVRDGTAKIISKKWFQADLINFIP